MKKYTEIEEKAEGGGKGLIPYIKRKT